MNAPNNNDSTNSLSADNSVCGACGPRVVEGKNPAVVENIVSVRQLRITAQSGPRVVEGEPPAVYNR